MTKESDDSLYDRVVDQWIDGALSRQYPSDQELEDAIVVAMRRDQPGISEEKLRGLIKRATHALIDGLLATEVVAIGQDGTRTELIIDPETCELVERAPD